MLVQNALLTNLLLRLRVIGAYIYHIANLEKTGYNVCKNEPRSSKKKSQKFIEECDQN